MTPEMAIAAYVLGVFGIVLLFATALAWLIESGRLLDVIAWILARLEARR